jgi:hypothetical protein
MGGERGEQRQNDLDARVRRPSAQPKADISDRQPECDLARDDRDEHQERRAERECAGRDRRDREAVENERRCIVGETFALDHHHGPPRQPEPARDRQRGDLVGRRDDGAEDESDRPVPTEQIVHDGGDRDRREGHAAECEQADRADIVAELAPAHRDPRRVDERREDNKQHQVGRQLDPWQAGGHGKEEAEQNQKNGRGNSGPVRRNRDHRHGHKNENQDKLDRHALCG